MRMRQGNRFSSGITMMEVIISSIIVAITLAGTANLFLGSKSLLSHAHHRMGGTELGKVFINPLQMQVREDTWGTATNDLTVTLPGQFRYCNSVAGNPQMPGNFCPSAADRVFGGSLYSAQYDIKSDVSPNPQMQNLRRVTTTITWRENRS